MTGWGKHIALGSLAASVLFAAPSKGVASWGLNDSVSANMTETEVMCARKVRLLETYLNSPSAKQIDSQGSQAAREMLAKAWANLLMTATNGGIDEQCSSIDEGLRLITAAMVTSGVKATDKQKHKSGYERGARQLGAYLRALSVSSRDQWSTELKMRIGEAEVQIARAERLADKKKYEEAHTVMESAYAAVLTIVRDLHDGKSVVNELVFETPFEEYKYEVDKNRSYEMLVSIALSELPASEELQKHVAKVFTQNEVLRDRAREKIEAENFPDAIRTIESANRDLAKTLRFLGVMVWD